MNGILIHYGEIALKKGNRRRFEFQLIKNLRAKLRGDGICSIERLPGRIFIALQGDVPRESIRENISKVFGVHDFSFCWRLEPHLEELKGHIAKELAHADFQTFAIRARRGERQVPFGSQFVNETLGQFVKETFEKKVDLDHPELTIRVEMLSRHFFLSFEKQVGPGGLPVGVSGRVLVLISGGIDSPVAAWRIVKRGCEAICLHFHSEPFTSKESQEKVWDLAQVLAQFQNGVTLVLVPFGEIQRAIIAKASEENRIILYRRMMMRIATALAKEYGASVLVTGESLAQVASQTLTNLSVIEEAAGLPVLRPLVGMDKEEIVAQAKAIGTYDISIRPHQDCCSLMVPRHPHTAANLEAVRMEESLFGLEMLTQMGLQAAKGHFLRAS